MKIRYLKVIRDLTSEYGKNLLLVLAISIGIFGVGAILGSSTVINREMKNNYMATAPASATLELEQNISSSLLDSVRSLPGIKDAERRATIVGRMYINERWYPILLFVIDDFTDLRMNKFRPISGSNAPGDGAMLVERTALSMMQAEEGSRIKIKTSDGSDQLISITGIVHDPGLAPAWQEQAGYGYISIATLKMLGEPQRFDLLRISVSEHENSDSHIAHVSQTVADWLTAKNYTVHEIQMPPPVRHPHQSQMNAVLSIFTIFSFMILLLASILVATSMATIMVRHIKQIGVMKTIGATSVQIAGLYFLMMIILSTVALVIAIPLSRLAANAFALQIAELLNIDIIDSSIPYWVPLLQVVCGILIPMIAAAIPVIRGSRRSIRKALDNHSAPATLSQTSWLHRLSRSNFFNDTWRIALRNVFRQVTRLVFTLILLASGGAMFMTALNVSDAWDKNLEGLYIQRLYDLEVRLAERMNTDDMLNKLKNIKGVKAVEAWDYAPTSIMNDFKYEVTRTYPDKGHGSFTMMAVPVTTKILNPNIKEGRWLGASGLNEVVLNQGANPSNAKVGDSIFLSVNGEATKWKVVGFTEDMGSGATAYVCLADFSKALHTEDMVKSLRIAYHDRSKDFAIAMNRKLDAFFEKQKISLSSSTPVWLLRNAVAGHMRVLINSLVAMALLMGVVGTIGLMSVTSMNVLERTREIGVMRAIGATPGRIRNMIILEGLTIGMLSIFIAFSMSLMMSYYMGEFIGRISFGTPLALAISPLALVIWFIIIIAGSLIATLLPAKSANRITTHAALSYQ